MGSLSSERGVLSAASGVSALGFERQNHNIPLDCIQSNRPYKEGAYELSSLPLAKKYFDHYRNLGGIYGWDTNIRIDFMIIACASFNGLDV
ncbi:MAG: hypothetical protein ABIH82_06295, partial [Candidatus Woesearchaeota archaeon]